MLRELVVEGLGVIEHADVALAPGSTALTGETGAGKTLVVAAVGLLLGGRADRSIVRTGASEARVEGRFVLPSDHPVVEVLVEADLADQPEEGTSIEVLVVRTVGPSGSRARINGRIVTLTMLGEIVGELVEIAGQNEHQRIFSPAFQRRLLDGYAGTLDLACTVAASVRDATAFRARAEELRDGERARSRELDVLRYEIDEITKAQIDPGEALRLAHEVGRLENAASIALGLTSAIEMLRSEGGAEDASGGAEREIRRLAEHDDSLLPLAQRLEAARLELNDIAAELADRMIEPDPETLETTRERLDVISKLRRKYGDSELEILEYLGKAQARASELEGESGDADTWEAKAIEAHERALGAAAELSAGRREAAERLAVEVQERLATLALGEARFEVILEERPLYEGGFEAVTFAASTNKGESVKPIAKAASGGELSRIALALHLAESTGSATTMVFDEVDAGVGGKAAQAVGRALADLSRTSGAQVVVVTHLPQVAAFADNHLMVAKVSVGDRTTARVERVDEEARVEELSRMLAGLPGSEVGQEHAKELLALAATKVPVA